jgi:hypothetical protein
MNNTLIPNSQNNTHPFKISYKYEAGGNISVSIRSESFLYSPPTSVGGSFSKININALDTNKSFSRNSISGQPINCILELKVQSLQVQSANIVWSQGGNPQTLEFGSGMDQKAARILIASIRNDSKYNLGTISAGLSSLYIDQMLSSNLIVANMVFNSVPVIFPVPFCGILT